MKKIYALLLAALLLLTACAGRGTSNDISVQDTCCPYKIKHQRDCVEITLQDRDRSGILWQVEANPADICEVTQEQTNKDDCVRYRISGKLEGAAELTFTALRSDESVAFDLTLIVTVDANGKPTVTSCDHREKTDVTVEDNGLKYNWNVDVDGVLHFFFIDSEDFWSVSGDGEGVCVLSYKMSTPSGCQFHAAPKAAGQTGVLLIGEKTGRTVRVVIEVNENRELKVVSVQEQ